MITLPLVLPWVEWIIRNMEDILCHGWSKRGPRKVDRPVEKGQWSEACEHLNDVFYVQELTLCLATSFQTFCELSCKRCSEVDHEFELFLNEEVQNTGLSAFSSMRDLIHNVRLYWSHRPFCMAWFCYWPCSRWSFVSNARSLRSVALSPSASG